MTAVKLETNQTLIDKEGKATPYFEDYLQNFVTALGGEGAPAIPDIPPTIINNDMRSSVAQLQISTEGFTQKNISANYTSFDKEWLNVSGGATVRMMLNPTDDAVIIARNSDGTQIKFDGNGRNINGEPSQTTISKDTILAFYYFRLNNEWFMTTSVIEDTEHKHRLLCLLTEIATGIKLTNANLDEVHDTGLTINDVEGE